MSNSSTSQPVDPADVKSNLERLDILRRTLSINLKKQAKLRLYTPPYIVLEIEDTREEIHHIKQWLQLHGVLFENSRDDVEDSASSIQKVSDGLGVLTYFMQVPKVQADVRGTVVDFHDIFLNVHDDITKLTNDKILHDQLHKLQFHCYDMIEREKSRFPEDELTCRNFALYEYTLGEIVHDLQKIIARSTNSTIDRSAGIQNTTSTDTRWVHNLDMAWQNLKLAIDQPDVRVLRQVMWQINRVLTDQPVRINTRLTETVRGLRLPKLIDTLISISQILARPEFDPSKVKQFEIGLHEIQKLDTVLRQRIDEHDGWQEVGTDLRLLDSNPNDISDNLEVLWPELKARVIQLCTCLFEWAIRLLKEGAKLEQALQHREATRIRRCFHGYKSQADLRFYIVDTDLKDLCDKLGRISKPLAAMLRIAA